MKRVILFFMLMLVSSCAWAEIHEFKYFYIDIPEGWSVQENDSMIKITSSDKSESLMIKADSLRGESFDKLAVKFSHELGASVVKIDSDDDYTFEFNDDKRYAILTGDTSEDFYMLIAGSSLEHTGQPESSDVLLKILDSLEIK